MTRRTVISVVLGVSLIGSVGLVCSPARGGEPEAIWAELGRLPREERQERLLARAREEGTVVFYANISSDHLEPLRADFEKRYPGVRLDIWRGSGEKTANRVLTESRAGKFLADVVGPGNEYTATLIKANLVGRYRSPEREFYAELHKDREGYWTSLVYNLTVMAYNTRLVPEKRALTGFEDFLHPKWKGSFALDMDPDRALMIWLKMWGEEKTERFLRGLTTNGVVVRKGHTLITQLLCAGEFKAAVELYAYRAAEMKHKGCPLEMVYTDPTPGAVTPLVVAKRAPHPYAAALLVDYLLSEAGQKILAGNGWFSGRRGVKPPYPELDVEGRGVRVLLLRPEDAEQFGKTYQELRERFLLGR